MKKVTSSQPDSLVLNWIKHSFSLWVSLKKRGQHGIKEKITMAIDTQANLAESDKGSFCNQREWSKFYYGEFINYY